MYIMYKSYKERSILICFKSLLAVIITFKYNFCTFFRLRSTNQITRYSISKHSFCTLLHIRVKIYDRECLILNLIKAGLTRGRYNECFVFPTCDLLQYSEQPSIILPLDLSVSLMIE